jgi:hypothetical protein
MAKTRLTFEQPDLAPNGALPDVVLVHDDIEHLMGNGSKKLGSDLEVGDVFLYCRQFPLVIKTVTPEV